MEREIEKLEDIIVNIFATTHPFNGKTIAEKLYEAGYRRTIDKDMLKAIDCEIENLHKKTCENLAETIDEFKCSECGYYCDEVREVEIDEDDGEKYHYEYEYNYCPNCGRKVKY